MIRVGDLVVRASDGTQGVVVALGDEVQPWWERPIAAKNRRRVKVQWLPLGPTRWISRATQGSRWKLVAS